MSSSPQPPAVQRLLAAVRAGEARHIVPPVVMPGPQGTLAPDRRAGDPARARYLENLLREERGAPLAGLAQRLDAWCARAARSHAATVAPGVLDPANDGLFGPLLAEAVTVCATEPDVADAQKFVAEQADRWESFLDTFLDRLRDDLGSCWPTGSAHRGPVVAVRCQGDETHHGRCRVLRVDLAGGARVAYKPRPVDGEALFLGELSHQDPARPPEDCSERPQGARPPSVFGFLNRLPPVSGPVHLPELPSWRGGRPDRAAYSWQQWVTPPSGRHVVATSGDHELTASRLEPKEAVAYWRRTGSLTAACLAFGIADMHGGNLIVGTSPDTDDPAPFPVDLEVYFADVRRLHAAGLLPGAEPSRSRYHAGLATTPHWAADGGPPFCLRADAAGALRLSRRDLPYTRTHDPSLVADTRGRTGYGAYLPVFLRGMFDLWTLLCRHRGTVRDFLAEHTPGRLVRVVPRATSVYCRELPDRRLRDVEAPGREEPALTRAELAHLSRMDVPYFFRDAEGGTLLHVDPLTGLPQEVPPDEAPPVRPFWPPSEDVRRCDRFDLASLGAALRDVVEHVRGEMHADERTDPACGVRILLTGRDRGRVSFDWPETGRRIRYGWSETTVTLRIDRLVPETPGPEEGNRIRERLLRIDRLDASLRTPWADGGFTDDALCRRLDRLTGTAVPWLDEVIARYGWPGIAMVGDEPAAAACRLVQHVPAEADFQERCLALLLEAAEAGQVPAADVAGVWDAVRLAHGEPQKYGTKFHVVEGELVPCPIEREESVDRRRAAMGLEPLAAYAARLRRRFPSAGAVRTAPAEAGTG